MTAKQLRICADMLDNRDVMKRLYGERWAEVTAEHRELIRKRMILTGESNPLKAVLPIAKSMDAAGENPALLLAVAVDMSEGESNHHPQPGAKE